MRGIESPASSTGLPTRRLTLRSYAYHTLAISADLTHDQRMRRNLPWFASLLVVLAILTLPSPPRARACVIDPGDPRFDGIPADGDTDVPTNVVPIFFFLPWYEEPTTEGVPGTFVIETLDGKTVETTAQPAASQWFEIVPARFLEPNTSYRIRGTWNRSDRIFETQLEFTTGAGPHTEMVEAPAATLQHLDWRPSVSTSCDGELQRTCVALEQDAMIEYDFVDEFGQIQDELGYIARASFFTTVLTTKLQQATNFRCIRLRTRAIDGTLSEYTKLCGDAAPVFHVAVDGDVVECTNDGLAWPKRARVTKDEAAAPLPTRGGGKAGAAGGAAAGSGGSFDPSTAGAPTDDPDADAERVEACSVRPGWERSSTGPTTAFAIWLAAWVIRRRRARAH